MIFLSNDPNLLLLILAEFKRKRMRVGKDSNIEDIQRELEGEFADAHIFINNRMSQLQDDDRVGDVYEVGDVLTVLGAPQDMARSNTDFRPPDDILVVVERNNKEGTHKIIFIPICNRPQDFKFRSSEFFPYIAVFR